MLEEAIIQNTAAIRELIATLRNGAHAPTPAEPEAEKAPVATPPATTKPATYEQAAKAITTLIKRRGRDAGMAILKQFNAARLPEVKPEQFAAVIAACEAETSAVVA